MEHRDHAALLQEQVALEDENPVVDAAVAMEIFRDNGHKVSQIPSIAAASSDGHSVTLYRLGDHVVSVS